MDIPLQDQIYIVSVALVVVIVFFLIFCIVLCVNVNRLKGENAKRNAKENEKCNPGVGAYAYNNPTIQRDEELHQRGYLMHQGQIVPRVKSAINSEYSVNAPQRIQNNASSLYSRSSRDFIPINDRQGTQDASKDFQTITHQSTSTFDDSRLNRTQLSTIANSTGNGYIPPRPSQFNNNILLGPSVQHNHDDDHKQEGVTYFNNRAIDY